MKRNLIICLSLVCLVAWFVHGSIVNAADPSEANLVEKIDKLITKVTRLERTLTSRLSAIERKIGKMATGGSSKVSSADEEAAKKELGDIRKLVGDGKFDQAKTQLAGFLKKHGSAKVARGATRMKRELDVIGKDAPQKWGIEKWIQGKDDVSLDSGQTTLVVFWEVWCPHCRREVPKIEALSKTYKEKGLQVVGLTKITKSATEEKVREFVKEQGIDYAIAKEDGSVSKYFNVGGIPAAAVVKKGKIVWRGHPAKLPKKLIESWL